MATTLPTLDAEKILGGIDDLKKGVGDLTIRMSANSCKTQEDYDKGIIQIKEGNLTIKKFKLYEDEKTGPAKLFVDRVRSAVKAASAPIQSAIEELKERGNAFIRAENIRKQKELDRLAAEKLKNDAKIETADTVKAQEKAIQKDAVIQQKTEVVKAHEVGGNARRRVFKVVDPSLVPHEYLLVDESKIRKNQGKVGEPFPNIPGVVFEDVQEMRG